MRQFDTVELARPIGDRQAGTAAVILEPFDNDGTVHCDDRIPHDGAPR